MMSVPSFGARPTNLAPLPRLLAYAQGLGLERHPSRAKRGIPTLALALAWLVLAWRGTGRPERPDQLDEPLLAALLGRERQPAARTLLRSVASFSAHDLRGAVEASYRAELPRRDGRARAALDTHHLPSWGRGKPDRFEKGRSGRHSRRLRGYRLFLATDTETGRVITSLLARGGAGDDRLLAVLARRVRVLLDAKIPFILGSVRRQLFLPTTTIRFADRVRARRMGVDEAVSQPRRRLIRHLGWRAGGATPPGPGDR